LLPAIQASHDDSDAAAAASTALFAFTWSFGAIWGITIPVAELTISSASCFTGVRIRL
jgi:hypothetical protein